MDKCKFWATVVPFEDGAIEGGEWRSLPPLKSLSVGHFNMAGHWGQKTRTMYMIGFEYMTRGVCTFIEQKEQKEEPIRRWRGNPMSPYAWIQGLQEYCLIIIRDCRLWLYIKRWWINVNTNKQSQSCGVNWGVRGRFVRTAISKAARD